MDQIKTVGARGDNSSAQQFTWQALSEHFGDVPAEALSSARRQFPYHMRPELQQSLVSQLLPLAPRLLGVNQSYERMPLKISGLLVKKEDEMLSLAPVQSQDVDVGEEAPVTVFENGFWLVSGDSALKAAVLFSHHVEGYDNHVAVVEIVCLPNAAGLGFARQIFAGLEQALKASRLYRGKVLSLEQGDPYSGKPGSIQVHRLPAVARDDVILSASTMQLLDRNIFGFAASRGGLKALRQSLQKGILLYGPPGTGKTHTIRYLASNLPGHTTLLISADEVAQLDRYMLLARQLQPSMVVIEDVDLIGRDRNEMRGAREETLLNRLLNEMDGLHPDAEILFILTTNRPEAIEEALAARPGRVDQAIEVPLPDAESRARLLALYGSHMTIPPDAASCAVQHTEGVSAAFIKELVRRLAQESIVRGAAGEVNMADVESVLHDMVTLRNGLNHALLGAAVKREPRDFRYASSGCF